MSDWRLQGQESFLQNVSLKKSIYKKYRNNWEHDHCEFCGSKFSENKEDLNSGYVTLDNYHWICESCFQDFKEKFHWTVLIDKS